MFYTISQHVCVCVCVCVCVGAKILVESICKPECVISLFNSCSTYDTDDEINIINSVIARIVILNSLEKFEMQTERNGAAQKYKSCLCVSYSGCIYNSSTSHYFM